MKLNLAYRIGALAAVSTVVTLTAPGSAQTQPVDRSPPAAQSKPTQQQPAASQPAERPDLSPVVLPGSRIQWDIPYVEHPDPLQKLDVYAPAKAKAAPVVMFVHGGEWARHDKSEVSHKPKFLNQNGIIFVSVNYRLSGTAKHPAQVDDVAAAVRWTRDHIAEYGGDPEKIVLMGHSAGCHIVTLTGLDPRPLAKVKLKPSDLKGVVSWSGGAFDLVDKVKQGGMYADYIHINFGNDEKIWRDASPMNHIGEARPMPHFLFASADGDRPTSIEASDKMTAMIREVGGKADRAILAGKNHTTANQEVGMQGDKSGEVLLRFVRETTGTTSNHSNTKPRAE